MSRPKLPTDTGTRVFSGARAVFLFNDSIVGFASGVSGEEAITYDPVNTLDHLEIREHVPVAYHVTFSAQIFRTIANGPSTDDEGPGSLKQQNIFPKFGDILRLRGVDAIIQDSMSKKVLFQLSQVKCASYQFNVMARSLVQQNVTFVAIKVSDESDLAI